MVTKSIELFVICADYEYTSKEEEYFNTFEDARNHISDMDESGRRYKYSGWWSDRQTCEIKRIYIEPGMKCPECTNIWSFKDGKLDPNNSYVWNHEHAYRGKVW